MKILGKKLSIEEFKDYVARKTFGSIPPNFLVIHHTWKPTEKDWQGEPTIESLKKFYEGKGWEAGPHLFIAPDGIWLFTDMYEVGIHAGEGNAVWKSKNGKIWKGWGKDFTNNTLVEYSIGIEVVGNYDGAKWTGDIKRNALSTIKILQEKLGILNTRVMFHSDYSKKSCPGLAITKEWLYNKLNEFNLDEENKLKELEEGLNKVTKENDILKEKIEKIKVIIN